MAWMLDWLFPPRCPFCRRFLPKGEGPVCRDCLEHLPHCRERAEKHKPTFVDGVVCALVYDCLLYTSGVVYGNPEVTTGGRALKFYSSVRIEIRRTEHIKVGSTNIGSRTRAKVVKNKIAPPFKEAEFDIMYGEGISKLGELGDLGVKFDLVQKSGAWYSRGETRLGQGRDAAKQFFKDNPEIAEELEEKIKEALKNADSGKGKKDKEAGGKKESAPARPAAKSAPPKGCLLYTSCRAKGRW